MGGALLLPYFSFNLEAAAENKGMFVTPADFPIATKAALQFYFDKELAYDQLYFIGDSMAQKVGNFSTGTKTQENLPHYIEIVAGLAAFDFFLQPAIPADHTVEYLVAKRDSATISFDSLPFAKEKELNLARRADAKADLTIFTTLAYVFNTYGWSFLEKRHEDIKLEAWYLENFRFNPKKETERNLDPHFGKNKIALDAVREFFNQYIKWICGIDKIDVQIKLFDRKKLLAGEYEPDKELELIDPARKNNISSLLEEENVGKTDFNHFVNNYLLPVRIKDPSMAAADKYLSIFYQACRQFCKENYNVQPKSV